MHRDVIPLGNSDQPGLESIAGELDKDAEIQSFRMEMILAFGGSASSPADSDTHQTLKTTVLREM